MSRLVHTPLRVCRFCGLEAHSKEDLEKFVKNHTSRYGRKLLCRECGRKRPDDRYYLRIRFYLIKQRCYDQNGKCYPNYGGRGITVCREWLENPNAFVDWALSSGWRRELQIDRIDNDGPYSPDNCHWVTCLVQQRNKRNTVTFNEKGTRVCCRCKVEKSLIEFPRRKERRGYSCNECRRAKRAQFHMPPMMGPLLRGQQTTASLREVEVNEL